MSRPGTRRDFLTGRSALDAIADLGQAAPPALPCPAAVDRPYLVQVSREAMACEFDIFLNVGQYPAATELALHALDRIDELENQLSIYRDDSEVSRLNRRAFDQPVAVEAGLFSLLQQAVRLHKETSGALDVTSGPLSRIWGFYRRQGAMPAAEEVRAALHRVGSQWLELNSQQQTVRFSRPGMEINLGAIGKGYSLDVAAEQLAAAGIGDFLFHGGHSSVLARGARALAESPSAAAPPGECSGWTVGLQHPLKPQVRLAEFSLRNQALGTSGSGAQFFHYQGQRFGHILDPRSGWPADQTLSATVIAPTAALADALSTAFYVLGVGGALEYCKAHCEVAALLVTAAADGGQIELHPINLAADSWRPLSTTAPPK